MSRRRRRLLWVLLPLSLAALAWLALRSSVPSPDPSTAALLEAAAERWWQPGIARRGIPRADWPAAVRRLGPSRVTVAPEGVYLQFGSFFVEEWGLFILPRKSPLRPAQGTDPSYRRLRGRVYRYAIRG